RRSSTRANQGHGHRDPGNREGSQADRGFAESVRRMVGRATQKLRWLGRSKRVARDSATQWRDWRRQRSLGLGYIVRTARRETRQRKARNGLVGGIICHGG